MTSIEDTGGEGLSFLYLVVHWEFVHAPVNIWAEQIRLGDFYLFFLFLFGGVDQMCGSLDMEGLGSKCDQGALCENLKQ